MTPRPPRLSLPWALPHYRPLNGPHPLVMSFLDGNPGVEPITLERSATVTAAHRLAVASQVQVQLQGLSPEAAGRYREWLNLNDQLVIEAQGELGDALFLHTTPLYAGSRPWIFHFESFPSLFMPFMFTGETTGIDLKAQPGFERVRQALASPQCLRIFSHMRGSLDILTRVFDDPDITHKCHYVPLGIEVPEAGRALAKFDAPGPLRMLFTNSLHGDPRSFYLRGGHHMLSAYIAIRRQLPSLELTVLSSLPPDLFTRFARDDLAGVTWLQKRVDDADLETLLFDHHYFALPAAGLHSYSLLRALSHGCVPIVSDAPGYAEYTQGIETSVLPMHGVREQVYRAEAAGWLSDSYAPFIERSSAYAKQIHDAVLDHAQKSQLKAMAAHNLAHCRQHFGLAASHAAFNRMLDAGLLQTEPVPIAPVFSSHPDARPAATRPMRLYIHTANHDNSNSITDTVLFLKNALQDCGFDACISHEIMPGELNILIEHFVDEKSLRSVLDGWTAGARYILIGTEPIIGGTFNGGIVATHWHYSNTNYWKLRYDAFLVVARMAEAVWVLAQSMVPGYAALLPDKPVRFLPHGHVNGFATVQQRPESQRDIDFHFSGSMTEHRQRVLRTLARTHKVVWHHQQVPEYLRQDQLSRSKVCLSLRLSPENRIPSVSRMHFHLQNKSFLVHEAYALPCPLDPFVLQTPSDDLIEWAHAALHLDNRREIAESMHERFRLALPMTELLPPLLDEVLRPMRRAA